MLEGMRSEGDGNDGDNNGGLNSIVKDNKSNAEAAISKRKQNNCE